MKLKIRPLPFALGAIAVSVGVGLIYFPAGIITAGIVIAASAFITPAPKENVNGNIEKH